MMFSLFSFTREEFSKAVQSALGKGSRHAAQLYSDFMQKGVFLIDDRYEKNSFPLLYEIIKRTQSKYPKSCKILGEGEMKKCILTLEDSLEIEMVLIPMKTSGTLCISSQVGCKKACAFCETGRMGLIRDLTVEEIVVQVFYARFVLGFSFRNLVFMGMGEPLDNYENVKKALKIFMDTGGLGFGSGRITLSTSGVVDKMERMIEEINPPVHLAISINAPNDIIRNKIMPINRKWSMHKLKEVMLKYCRTYRKKILIEYVLIDNVNDRSSDADELAKYLKDLEVKINVIPYNPQRKDRFSPPSEEKINEFVARLRGKGFYTLLRKPKGQEIYAACGQLGNISIKSLRKYL